MNIRKATSSYESWIDRQAPLIPAHLALKHEQMASGPFPFLRATFYRWAQLWPEHGDDARNAPDVLSVGDLHVENFGTWRDAEGRLAWGINDFDEAFTLPCTFDLVRLAASVLLARASQGVLIDARSACEAILNGYTHAIRAGGRPFVLGERHNWLRAVAQNELRDPVSFWQRMQELPSVSLPIPADVRERIERLMPEAKLPYDVVERPKGLGSLGHPRYIALADYRGGLIAREAKGLTQSACVWAWQLEPRPVQYPLILKQAIRCPDPMVRVDGNWLVRRLAPDCSRIELSSLGHVTDEARLLNAMGAETANIHLGDEAAVKAISKDLKGRSRNWLRKAAQSMVKATMDDFKDWRKEFQASIEPSRTPFAQPEKLNPRES